MSAGHVNSNRTDSGGVPDWQEGWQFDETGNWLAYDTAVDGTATQSQERSYNPANELLFIDDSNATVTHDAVGNMTVAPSAADCNVSQDFEYTLDGQLAVLIARNAVTGDQVARWPYGTAREKGGVANE